MRKLLIAAAPAIAAAALLAGCDSNDDHPTETVKITQPPVTVTHTPTTTKTVAPPTETQTEVTQPTDTVTAPPATVTETGKP